jgi:BMFP domain-containing protein YqiC
MLTHPHPTLSLYEGEGFKALATRTTPLYIVSMQKDSKLFEDIAKMASGAAGAAMDMRRELESMVSDKLERLITRGKFVTREEFDVVRDMAQKARTENEALRVELEKLKK